MKWNKTHSKQMLEYLALMDEFGCVSVSEWVSGSGRFSKPKAIPPFVKRVDKSDGFRDSSASKYFYQHPKRKSVLVLDKESFIDFALYCMQGAEFKYISNPQAKQSFDSFFRDSLDELDEIGLGCFK